MPLPPELRRIDGPYGRAWLEVTRPRILKRAGGKFDEKGKYLGGAKCEQCGKPDRTTVETISGHTVLALDDIRVWMFWRSVGPWYDQFGQEMSGLSITARVRSIWVQIQVAHLNHVYGDDRDENLKALCGWCHLNFDRCQHRLSRQTRRDAARPLLSGVNLDRGEAAGFANSVSPADVDGL